MDTDIIRIMRNWGCDFLFAYALFFALYVTETDTVMAIKYSAACSIVLELLQLIQVDFLKCGTFDMLDIIVEIIAICIGAIFISSYNHVKNNERSK